MPRLSATLITKNEAHDIESCLDSLVGWVDEIVVVDSGSKDGTPDICRRYGAKVIETTDWPGFGPQKNRALDAARGEWIFSIDADERVPAELRDEILAVLGGAADGFDIPRLSSFLGVDIHHCGWRPDYVLRLFRRDKGRFSDDAVHEHVIVQGKVARLKASLLHRTMPTLEEAIDKANHYSTVGAQKLAARGKPGGPAQALLRGGWAFFRTYVLRRGFLDGRHGLILAIYNGETTYYRYLKHWLTQQGRDTTLRR